MGRTEETKRSGLAAGAAVAGARSAPRGVPGSFRQSLPATGRTRRTSRRPLRPLDVTRSPRLVLEFRGFVPMQVFRFRFLDETSEFLIHEPEASFRNPLCFLTYHTVP